VTRTARGHETSRARGPSTGESLREYGRGLAGGFLFSLPLLYTMEVWWTGFTMSPARLLAGVAGTFLLLCAYNAYAGLRHDTGMVEILIDSVEELGLGLAVSAVMLTLLGLVDPLAGGAELLGNIVLEGLIVAIGVSVGTAQLVGGEQHTGGPRGRHSTLSAEITLALCGAVLIAANVAPTDEIPQLAAGMTFWHLLGVIIASLFVALTLLYFSDFKGSARFAEAKGTFAVLHGAAITYAVALLAAAALLWFLGRFEGITYGLALAQAVTLALPGTLGAAAGRLLLR
jgi:putative integral membrane protein (TIGR02587 family)